MTSAHRWQERRQLRRLERRRRRGGNRRGPMVLQRSARRVSGGIASGRQRVARATRGDRPLVVVLAGALVLAVLIVSGPAQSYLDGRARVEALQVKQDALEEENARLGQRVDDLQDPSHVELLAREQQGLVLPGEVPYTLVPPSVERPRITSPRERAETESIPWYQRLWDGLVARED